MGVNRVLTIDGNLRTIRLPFDMTNIGVVGDKNVTRLTFQAPRVYGGFLLDSFQVSINYFNAIGEGDVYIVTDVVAISNEYITFSWLIDDFVTAYSGKVRFNVHFERTDGGKVIQEYNTTYVITNVLEALNPMGSVYQKYPTIVEKWKNELFGRFDGKIDANLRVSGMAADAAVTGQKIKKLEHSISSPYNFKGNCTYAQLPSSALVNDTYYCTDKKCRYTWNGQGWYQSSMNENDYLDEIDEVAKLVDKVEPDKYKLVYANIEPNNMISKNKLEAGYYVDTTGVKRAGAGWNLSDKIYVSGLTYVYFYGGIGLTCFYAADDTFISYVNNVSGKIDIPAGTSYLRASIVDSYKNTAMIVKYESLSYDEGLLTMGRKGYEEGIIEFTVPVNQTVACTSLQSQGQSETEEYVDVNCILSLPKNYTAFGKPVGLVMMCHGAGKGVDEWRDHEGYLALIGMFRSRGYAVFDCNGFKNDALGWSFWGDQRGVEAWRKAYKYVVDNYNVEKTFSIYAFSMGGLTAMNLAFQAFPNINCIAMGSPVLNLRACWDDESVRPVLKTLYGLGDEWDDSKVVGCNPFKHIVKLDSTSYCIHKLPPIKIWYGSTEQSYGVDKKYAIELVEAIRNSGGYAQYIEIPGAGHEICYGMNHYCNVDYLFFIERYNKTDYIT